MLLHKMYSFDTRVGVFFIAQSPDERFHPVFNDDSLGSYHSAGAAAEDLAGGRTPSVTGVRDTSALGIPPDVSEWTRVS
jgi:hypothetical protein